MREERLEVITVPTKELLEGLANGWIDFPTHYGELIDIEVTADGKPVRFVFTEPWLSLEKNTGEMRTHYRAKLEMARKKLKEIDAKYHCGEVTIEEWVDLTRKELDGFKVVGVDESGMLELIHKIRYPSFWGSFFKPQAWLEPGVCKKITKVELTSDGVEFTISEMEWEEWYRQQSLR